MALTREQRIAHRYLCSFGMTGDRLESALAGLERAESARSSITGSIGSMGLSGGQSDKMCDALARIDGCISEIGRLTDTFSDQFREVEDFVTEVQRTDPMAGRCLRCVYIEGATASDAAAKLGCSKKTVYEYVKRGLDAAFDILAGDGDI